MHRYFPHTPAEIEEMLGTCGLSQLADLYSDVPSELKLKAPYKLPAEMGETEVREFFNCLGARNADIKACFAGVVSTTIMCLRQRLADFAVGIPYGLYPLSA